MRSSWFVPARELAGAVCCDSRVSLRNPRGKIFASEALNGELMVAAEVPQKDARLATARHLPSSTR